MFVRAYGSWDSHRNVWKYINHKIESDFHNVLKGLPYLIEYSYYIEKDAEIVPAHYTWKVAKRGLKIAFMMNKLAIINSG